MIPSEKKVVFIHEILIRNPEAATFSIDGKPATYGEVMRKAMSILNKAEEDIQAMVKIIGK